MKVKMLESRAGNAEPRYNLPDNFSFQAGSIEELDDALAEAWIAAGIAEAIEEQEPKPHPRDKKPPKRAE